MDRFFKLMTKQLREGFVDVARDFRKTVILAIIGLLVSAMAICYSHYVKELPLGFVVFLVVFLFGCAAVVLIAICAYFTDRKRKKTLAPIARHSTPAERAKTADGLDDGHFGAICELFLELEILELETHSTSHQMPSQNMLNRFAEWPDIEKLSCCLFGDAAFTRSTWDQLTVWLMKLSRINLGRCAAMPRTGIVELLREAVAEKQKTGSVLGGPITNQELRLRLQVLKATKSSSSEVLRDIREYIAENGAVDSAVRKLLAEKSSDAGDVIDRLGCLLGGGVLFPK
jgi:hypothetical protein